LEPIAKATIAITQSGSRSSETNQLKPIGNPSVHSRGFTTCSQNRSQIGTLFPNTGYVKMQPKPITASVGKKITSTTPPEN